MEMTGTRYLVAGGVGYVEFGHTNTLNGAQWVAAFENALQQDRPWCFGPDMNGHNENMLLIREKPDLVKVVPRRQLTAYQQAGLVNRAYVPPEE